MARGGAKKTEDETLRRCVITGESQPPYGMIRLVVSPDGIATPDLMEKLPGRGIWVSADLESIKSLKKKGLSRAAKTKVEIPEALEKTIEAGLAANCINLLSLARKSGAAVTGFEKVKSWLETERAAVLLQAADGAENSKQKLRPPYGENSYIGVLTKNEIGAAFGREFAIHAALADHPLKIKFLRDTNRLRGLRDKIADS